MHIDIPKYEKKINYEIKDLNRVISTKSYDLLIKDKNNSEINKNNLINPNNKHSTYIFKSKITNDNSKLIGNIKNTFANKRNRQDSEKMIHNYNEDSLNKFNNTISKKIGLVSIPIKQSKLILFEQNKNLTLLRTQGKTRSNEKRNNKFLFPENREIQLERIIANNSKANKKVTSKEKKNIQICHSQKNTKENFNKENNNFKTKIKNNNINIINEFNVNKTHKDFFPSINNKENVNKLISNPNKSNIKEINKNNKINDSNNINKDKNNKLILNINENINNGNINNNEIQMKSLSKKEKALYILSQSNVLSLCEKIIFSRATENIRKLISIKDILKSNEIFIKNKIKELEIKLINYNKIIENPFTPTRTAIISLNLIMKDDEDDFKYFDSNIIDENEKYYYYIYINLLYSLLGGEFKENNFENIDVNAVYDKLSKKGFNSFKDYLYQIFILHKYKKEFFNEKIIDKFNELFEEIPNLIKYEGEIKNNKFICFSYFILYEVNCYWKKYKEYTQLIFKIKNSIELLKKKISFINK